MCCMLYSKTQKLSQSNNMANLHMRFRFIRHIRVLIRHLQLQQHRILLFVLALSKLLQHTNALLIRINVHRRLVQHPIVQTDRHVLILEEHGLGNAQSAGLLPAAKAQHHQSRRHFRGRQFEDQRPLGGIGRPYPPAGIEMGALSFPLGIVHCFDDGDIHFTYHFVPFIFFGEYFPAGLVLDGDSRRSEGGLLVVETIGRMGGGAVEGVAEERFSHVERRESSMERSMPGRFGRRRNGR
mmetsp:Transcript_24874/g.44948  ORF Transcript_24874/g.44948 Transcript_24874/m.44948 type:complete len:239 (-) Transcript_24874:641-1357(-)